MVAKTKVKKVRTKHKSETVLVKTHLGLRRMPRYGFRDTPKGIVKLDRETGDTFFIPVEGGKERRIRVGHEARKKIKIVW